MYIRRNKSKTENGGHGNERVEIDARLGQSMDQFQVVQVKLKGKKRRETKIKERTRDSEIKEKSAD